MPGHLGTAARAERWLCRPLQILLRGMHAVKPPGRRFSPDGHCRPGFPRQTAVAHFGVIDSRTQTQIARVLKTDTPRSMGPKETGGTAMRAAVGRTDARTESGVSAGDHARWLKTR